ncbi:uncharacterized protein LOC133301289 [Gastrolobium bilobum]|uniref:uncharacterized protein LOC133301289 n=1 Tax=Gastrolobium bilobum TaxID=150636 RepID=UPI002AB2DBC6|nr:uncharacterized protein LOC133301289 [Gastrolobium bilobum]XP_061356897.1 uncharacterized protein LOC133301289 [Gastrolobium bilobum]XP_061356898.1 uncharacterized protein LOC133301289 [Gastrolobium bilobum]XP_061356899.1 uncharacterized protein LOC133301289 [Gastrolobium bilobum]
MAETNSRETRRRRRILQQGSDRLAFISGRIQNLPPPDPDPDPDDSSSQSQPLISDDPDTSLTTVLPHGDAEKDSDSILQTHDPYHSDASKSIIQTPPLHEHESESEISIVPTSEIEPEPEAEHVQPQSQPPPLQDSSLDISNRQSQPEEPKNFINPSDISSAVNASRVTRLCCSIAVALLVVASYLGFSLTGIKLIKRVISFRPLYLVLVTNLTVVVARLLSGKQKGFERFERRQSQTSSDGDQWDSQLARILELGLVVQNVMDAVFMDCAVYAIVLVCGLSLVPT